MTTVSQHYESSRSDLQIVFWEYSQWVLCANCIATVYKRVRNNCLQYTRITTIGFYLFKRLWINTTKNLLFSTSLYTLSSCTRMFLLIYLQISLPILLVFEFTYVIDKDFLWMYSFEQNTLTNWRIFSS